MGPQLASLWGAQITGFLRLLPGSEMLIGTLSWSLHPCHPFLKAAPNSHRSPRASAHTCALPAPKPAPLWSPRCSASALSALKVTGNKAPDTAKDQALALPLPSTTPLWDPRSDGAWQLTPHLPLSSTALIYFNLLCFPPWLSASAGKGERRRGRERRGGFTVKRQGNPCTTVGKGLQAGEDVKRRWDALLAAEQPSGRCRGKWTWHWWQDLKMQTWLWGQTGGHRKISQYFRLISGVTSRSSEHNGVSELAKCCQDLPMHL